PTLSSARARVEAREERPRSKLALRGGELAPFDRPFERASRKTGTAFSNELAEDRQPGELGVVAIVSRGGEPFRFAKEPKRATDVARLRRDLAEVKERASDVARVAGLGLRADRLLEEASCLVESAGDAEGRSEPSQRETEKDAIAERPSAVDRSSARVDASIEPTAPQVEIAEIVPRENAVARTRDVGCEDATVEAERFSPFA